MENITAVGNHRAQWGEGPIWWDDRLLYVDIEKHLVLEFDPQSGKEKSWDVSAAVGRVGTVVPRSDGGLVVAGCGLKDGVVAACRSGWSQMDSFRLATNAMRLISSRRIRPVTPLFFSTQYSSVRSRTLL